MTAERGRPEGTPTGSPRADGDRGAALNGKYTFGRFVVGASNQLAHAAAYAVAEAPAKAYNPLFIYGAAGLGKTHLLQAVGHHATTLHPHLRCRYVTTEQFANDFIDAISNSRQAAFQRRYRDVDVLLVDDVQFLESKERTQEEFFHTFNALHTADKQIVISSDRPPNQIGHLDERLRARFQCGLTPGIQPPDLMTRMAVLRRNSAQKGVVVPDDVLRLIAERVPSDVRGLEGALNQVIAYGGLGPDGVTVDAAYQALEDILPDQPVRRVSADLIMAETARHFGVSVDELCSPSRARQFVNARQVAMYLTRELTDLSLPKIGQEFGGRDHTTVLHAHNKVSGLMAGRGPVRQQVTDLTSAVQAAARTS